jgi:hypothetical protein
MANLNLPAAQPTLNLSHRIQYRMTLFSCEARDSVAAAGDIFILKAAAAAAAAERAKQKFTHYIRKVCGGGGG